MKCPAIVHFTTSFLSIRPWFEGSAHPYAGVWKKFHRASPWKDLPYRELKDRKKIEKKQKIYRMLPKWAAVRIAGILHAYVKPIVYKIR